MFTSFSQCNPFHFGDKALLLGDAAHAMVPYYGQGMNAGMEDCSIFFSILREPRITIGQALEQFTEKRVRDAHAICDLAMYNYVEMRDLTKRFSFKCRKYLDTTLFRFYPNFWVPLYNSVSFTSMPYSKCIANRKWQDEVSLFGGKDCMNMDVYYLYFLQILTKAFYVTSTFTALLIGSFYFVKFYSNIISS